MTQHARLQRELFALTEVAKALTLPLELADLLNAVLQKIGGVIEPAEAGVVMLWDQDSGLLRAAAAFGYDLQILGDLGLRLGELITGKVFDARAGCLLETPGQVAQAMADMRPYNRQVMARSLGTDALPRCTLAAPITVGEQCFGVLILETINGPAVFTPRDIPFLQTIADLIALAIDRHRLSVQADAVRQERLAVQMRSEVLAVLSHELRMPLTSIQGYSSALLVDEIEWGEEKRRGLALDRKRVHPDAGFTQGNHRLFADRCQPAGDRAPAGAPSKHRPGGCGRAAAPYGRSPDPGRFSTRIPHPRCRPARIKQVLRNLLDNAVKYSPQGGLIVLRAEERPNDVVVMVADQGIGISPENLVPLFERYFRVQSAVNLHIPGTGLGLPIAPAIVEAHGGRIWAESQLGEGTSIYFSLPKVGNE